MVLSGVDGNGEAVKPYMTLNAAHYEKLRALHALHAPSSDDVFDERVFCVLCRYEALKGAGFQCAVPGAAFDGFRAHLGDTVECFASPFKSGPHVSQGCFEATSQLWSPLSQITCESRETHSPDETLKRDEHP